MKLTRFEDCTIRETDFLNVDLTESDFSGSDLTQAALKTRNWKRRDL